MKMTFMFLLLLSVSLNTFARQDEKSAFELLKTDLRFFTKTLSRDVPLYSWTSKKKLTKKYRLPKKTSVIFNDKGYKKFVFSRTKKFFTYNKSDKAWLGHGLYTYHNPVGSAEYGDTVIEIMVPKGNSYLDLRYTNLEFDGFTPDREIKLTMPTIMALDRQFSCTPLIDDAVTVGFIKNKEYFALSKNYFVKCSARAKILKRALRKLNIAFLNYAWSAGDIPLTYCPDSNAGTAAQLLVAGPWLKKAAINGFISTFSDDFTPEHRQAYHSIHLFTRALTYSTPTWDIFFDTSMTSIVEAKIKSKFGCGQYPEDKL